jgi:hypothetical protein
MVWRNPFRRSVAPRRINSNSGESDVSLIVVLCVAIMALTFVVVIPVMGVMYMDLNNARIAVEMEIKAMRELRKKMIADYMRGEP